MTCFQVERVRNFIVSWPFPVFKGEFSHEKVKILYTIEKENERKGNCAVLGM